MEVTQEYWDLNAGDAGSGWRWDTNLGTWIALRWDLGGAQIQSTRPGRRWDVILMELRRESYGLDWAEMRDEWRWDEHLETWMFIYDAWMELGCNFWTWVEVRHTSWNLHGFEMVLGWSWDAMLWTWMEWDITEMEVKRKCKDLYWAETWSGWRDVNLGVWMEVRWKSWDLVGGEMGPGFSWDAQLET